ncbi:hypothetical protein HanPI659440_Chr11g0420721 [Helianthus annuus]|nr:hypothetical protein HanPI659440_Chr11g0420721 [Helianthus annuus]
MKNFKGVVACSAGFPFVWSFDSSFHFISFCFYPWYTSLVVFKLWLLWKLINEMIIWFMCC